MGFTDANESGSETQNRNLNIRVQGAGRRVPQPAELSPWGAAAGLRVLLQLQPGGRLAGHPLLVTQVPCSRFFNHWSLFVNGSESDMDTNAHYIGMDTLHSFHIGVFIYGNRFKSHWFISILFERCSLRLQLRLLSIYQRPEEIL